MPSLTKHLLASPKTQPLYERATSTHPFLISAANGTLSFSLLAYYLAQDRIYAGYAYPKFIGGLVKRIDAYQITLRNHHQPKSLLPLLTASLTGVISEVAFFDEFARQHGLDVSSSTTQSQPYTSRTATLNYVAEMAYTAEWAATWEEGVLFLWAMEKVYLDAWSHIRESLKSSGVEGSTHTALRTLSAHWSTEEFTAFVDDLGTLVDEISTPELEARAEAVWTRVLELEGAFWPLEAEIAG